MIKHFTLTLVVALFVTSCHPKLVKSEDPYFNGAHECAPQEKPRIGCLCSDGTFSKAKGSGACSGHGGVEKWLCK